jgi:hypothetical protein
MLTVNGKTIDGPDCLRWYVRGMTPKCRLGLNLTGCSECQQREPRNGNYIDPPIYEVDNAPPPAPPPAPMRGLGDAIARATTAVGIRPCGGCKKRQEALNRLVPFKENPPPSAPS